MQNDNVSYESWQDGDTRDSGNGIRGYGLEEVSLIFDNPNTENKKILPTLLPYPESRFSNLESRILLVFWPIFRYAWF